MQKSVLKNFAKFTRKYLCQACNFIKKETLAQVFSSELCTIFKNTFCIEHLWTTASVMFYLEISERASNWWHCRFDCGFHFNEVLNKVSKKSSTSASLNLGTFGTIRNMRVLNKKSFYEKIILLYFFSFQL